MSNVPFAWTYSSTGRYDEKKKEFRSTDAKEQQLYNVINSIIKKNKISIVGLRDAQKVAKKGLKKTKNKIVNKFQREIVEYAIAKSSPALLIDPKTGEAVIYGKRQGQVAKPEVLLHELGHILKDPTHKNPKLWRGIIPTAVGAGSTAFFIASKVKPQLRKYLKYTPILPFIGAAPTLYSEFKATQYAKQQLRKAKQLDIERNLALTKGYLSYLTSPAIAAAVRAYIVKNADALTDSTREEIADFTGNEGLPLEPPPRRTGKRDMTSVELQRDFKQKIREGVKSAMNKKAKLNEYVGDFFAGVEPTGVHTFNRAYKYKKRHKTHRAIGNIGGFLGGAAISLGMGAGGLALAGMALKKGNPSLAKNLISGARQGINPIINPKESIRLIKQLPKSSRIGGSVQELLGRMPSLTKDVKAIRSGKKITSGMMERFTGSGEEGGRTIKDLLAYEKKFGTQALNDFGGGIATLGGLTAAGLGGGLNSLSAHSQYGAARKLKKRDMNKYTSLRKNTLRKQANNPLVTESAARALQILSGAAAVGGFTAASRLGGGYAAASQLRSGYVAAPQLNKDNIRKTSPRRGYAGAGLGIRRIQSITDPEGKYKKPKFVY